MRRIELLRAKPEHFNGKNLNVHGKGRQGGKWRTVHYYPDTKRVLGEWLEMRAEIIKKARAKTPDVEVPDALLIYERNGSLEAYGDTGIDQILSRMRKRINEQNGTKLEFSNHTFRRSGGRMLWKAGVPLETISAILGHADPETTISYLGINLEDQAEAMLKLEKYQESLTCPKKGIFASSQ